MDWVAITPAVVLAALPVGDAAAYAAWIASYPAKDGRLAEIVTGIVDEFRAGLATNPANVLDEDTTKIPSACVRHALALVRYALLSEMQSVTLTTHDDSAMIRSEVFLRMLFQGHFDAGGSGDNLPSYDPPDAQAAKEIHA